MLTIAEVNQRRPRCAKCGCTADLLDIQDAALRQELLVLLRQELHVDFVKLFVLRVGCQLINAKATHEHIARAERKCHRCKTPLEPGDVVDCLKCRSVNLVWD